MIAKPQKQATEITEDTEEVTAVRCSSHATRRSSPLSVSSVPPVADPDEPRVCVSCGDPVTDANRGDVPREAAAVLAARGESLCSKRRCRVSLTTLIEQGTLVAPAEINARAAAIRAQHQVTIDQGRLLRSTRQTTYLN